MSTPTLHQQEILSARKRGINDFERGVSRNGCPYSAREKAEAWERGFDEALAKARKNAREVQERFR